jgi:hypothetical protein
VRKRGRFAKLKYLIFRVFSPRKQPAQKSDAIFPLVGGARCPRHAGFFLPGTPNPARERLKSKGVKALRRSERLAISREREE